MGTIIVLLVLIIMVVVAIYHSRQHFHGVGGCCGNTQDKVPEKCLPEITDRRQIEIAGIHCQNCQAKIRNAINATKHLACQKITFHHLIVVSDLKIDDEELKNIIEKTGYQVIKMEKV